MNCDRGIRGLALQRSRLQLGCVQRVLLVVAAASAKAGARVFVGSPPFDPFGRVPNRSGGGDEARSESDRPRPVESATPQS